MVTIVEREGKGLFSKQVLGYGCLILICLLVFGFPITSSIPVVLGVNSTPINIGLKFVYLLLACYLFVGGVLHNPKARLPNGIWLIIGFWIIYSARLLYDTQVVGLKFATTSFKFFSVAFGSCFFSAVAVGLTARFISLRKARNAILYTLILSNISIVAVVYSIYDTLNPIEIAARVKFIVELGDGTEIQILNPILISFYGELLLISGLAKYLYSSGTLVKKIGIASTICLGLFTLIIGASKGPLLAATLLVLFQFVAYFIYARKTREFLLKLAIIPLGVLLAFRSFVLSKIEWERLTIVRRLIGFAENQQSGEKEVRDFQWASAWQQFLEHPVIGDRFLDRATGYYPHNVYLESLMATGVVGSLLFFSLIIYALYRVFLQVVSRQDTVVYASLLLAILLANLTSGSLFGSIPLWIMLAAYLAMDFNRVRA